VFEARRKGAITRDDLFGRIGQFLDAQGLEPDPANYALAHAALADPDGPLALALARLTDGGVRLNSRDLEALGGKAVSRPVGEPRAEPEVARADSRMLDERAHDLVAATQAQVDGFADIMSAIHAETRGFGADLAASAAMMGGRQARTADEIARIAAAMVARIRDAESRLAQAREETDALRAKLAEARDTARRDALTSLANRRAFDEAYAARDEAAGPWSVAICDVDHFKRLNDTHGHAVGDRVLRAIAQTLASECDGHLVARYGGEEFAVLIGGLDPVAATALIDAARDTVAAKRFRTRDTDTPIGKLSFSAGVTAIQDGEAAGVAFERADRLLYTAKLDGRDCVRAG
jgi:diguanylate cyclase